MKAPQFPPLPRFLRLRRRPLAAACTFVAVLAALLALSPPPSTSQPVVAAASGLAAGSVLTRADLDRKSVV